VVYDPGPLWLLRMESRAQSDDLLLLERKQPRDKKGRFTFGSDGDTKGEAPAAGEEALGVPPKKLDEMTAAGDRRATALWYRAGDNSMETKTGNPGSYDMGQQMRSGKLDPEMRARVKDIDSVMSESHLPRPIEVYRGIGSHFDRFKAGSKFTDKSFVSTTTDPHWARGFGGTVMRIRVPAGTRAVRMANRSSDPPESEILLHRGLRFRVIGEAPAGTAEAFRAVRVLDVEVMS